VRSIFKEFAHIQLSALSALEKNSREPETTSRATAKKSFEKILDVLGYWVVYGNMEKEFLCTTWLCACLVAGFWLRFEWMRNIEKYLFI